MSTVLTITMSDTGEFGVSGPIENKIVCYGMLELAKESIQKHNEQNQKLVQPASFVLPRQS